MPRLEDTLAYASFTLLGLGVALGAVAFGLTGTLGAGMAQTLCLVGAAASAAAVGCILVSAKLGERRLRREERSGTV